MAISEGLVECVSNETTWSLVFPSGMYCTRFTIVILWMQGMLQFAAYLTIVIYDPTIVIYEA